MSLITGTRSRDILRGTSGDDTLRGRGGNDVLRGSRGDDVLDGGNGFDVANYTNLSVGITLKSVGEIEKGNFGTDTILQIEEIRGAKGFDNVVDGSFTGSGGTVEFDVSLENQFLNVFNIPGIGQQNFTIRRFVDVIGTQGFDFIEGDRRANFLDGQGGDDFIEGGRGADNIIGRDGSDSLFGEDGRDRLTGTDSFDRGDDEVDTLLGGPGRDRFILGDGNGSYYKSSDFDDFEDIPGFGTFGGFSELAFIDDFEPGERIELGAGETYIVDEIESLGAFDIYVERDGLGIFDAVARVTTTGFVNLPNGEFAIASGQRIGIFEGA